MRTQRRHSFCKRCKGVDGEIYCPFLYNVESDEKRKWKFCKKKDIRLDEVKKVRKLEREMAKIFRIKL